MMLFKLVIFLVVAYAVLVVADKQKTAWVKKIGYSVSGLIVIFAVICAICCLTCCSSSYGKFCRANKQMIRSPQMKVMMKEKYQQKKPVLPKTVEKAPQRN